jgi:hypothetical protein
MRVSPTERHTPPIAVEKIPFVAFGSDVRRQAAVLPDGSLDPVGCDAAVAANAYCVHRPKGLPASAGRLA